MTVKAGSITKTRAHTEGKSVYSKPRLKSFGSISELTTSGTGVNFESFAQGMCDESQIKAINPMCN